MLLIDADLRRPRVHEVFAVGMLVVPIELGGETLHVLPAGRPPANPAELLGGRTVKAVLAEAGRWYDIVLVDSTPVLPVSDSVALSGAVDGLLLVAQAGRTTIAQVEEETVAALNRVSAPVAGMVMNRVSGPQVARGRLLVQGLWRVRRLQLVHRAGCAGEAVS